MNDTWNAVFGAYVAVQVHQHIKDGNINTIDENMYGFVEEAMAVADMAIKSLAEQVSEDKKSALKVYDPAVASPVYGCSIPATVYEPYPIRAFPPEHHILCSGDRSKPAKECSFCTRYWKEHPDQWGI